MTYDGIAALDDVSVAVTAGQVTAVVGGDGAGKTSLLRCLAGALRPDEGEVHSPGKREIGYLPASSGVYPDLTVAENLAFRGGRLPAGRRGRGPARRAPAQRAGPARYGTGSQLSYLAGCGRNSASSPRCCTARSC